MNVQTHMSGQISGQVPNQMQQQNGNPIPPSQMQNLSAAAAGGGVGVAAASMYSADPELYRARVFMQNRILATLLQRHAQPINEGQKQKFKDIAKRLEEGLFKAAQTKDEYTNLNTLESRLGSLIKRTSVNNQNQRPVQLVNSSSSVGTMIPTPGSLLSHSGIHGGSFNRADGNLSNGYQQSPGNFSISSGGNMSTMGVQRMTSQMIPTPGFNNNNNSNQSFMTIESSNNGGGYSTVESTMVSQPQQQKQYVGGQNSRILQSLGGQMGSNIRSGLQQKPFGFPNGTLNSGMGIVGNNLQLVNEPGNSEGYTTATPYASSPKPLQQFDQHQRQLMQGSFCS